jgi:hydroxypyruvate reductase
MARPTQPGEWSTGNGPTDAAGGMVDGGTVGRMRERGIDPGEYLEQNNSYKALEEAGDLIVTGPTGTNVADLCFVAVEKTQAAATARHR